MRTAIDDLDDRFTVGWSSEQVTDIVLARISCPENGEPLGGSSRPGTRHGPNLDQATARRQSTPGGRSTGPSIQARIQRGVPSEGQYSARQHAEADIELDEPPG